MCRVIIEVLFTPYFTTMKYDHPSLIKRQRLHVTSTVGEIQEEKKPWGNLPS